MWERLKNPLTGIKEVMDKIPTEESINRFLEELPRIERIVTNGTLEKVAKLHVLADAVGEGKIDRLLNFMPLLTNLPENSTLVDIVNMKPLLAQMPSSSELKVLVEKLPSPEKLDELVKLLREMQGFLAALKG